MGADQIADDAELARLVELLVTAFRTWLPGGTTLTSAPLDSGMYRLDIAAANAGSAPITVLVSANESILEAGRGTRFELDPLPSSLPEMTELAQAIVAGRLVEWISKGRVDFELTTSTGKLRKGRQSEGLFRSRKSASRVDYLPFT
jgi:hypothetical protein